MLLRVENVVFSYPSADHRRILDDVSLAIAEGEFVAIRGKSGSGKSTLFHIIGCLLKPNSGHVLLDGIDLTKLTADEAALLRREKIGFVFQQFHLLPRATVLDNILLPTLYPCETARPTRASKEKALELAKTVGLADKVNNFPNQLSGGEQQRVVIARALMGDPRLILADEPTGNLDTANATIILDILRDLSRKGKSVLLITHDEEVAKLCSRAYHIVDGRFVEASPEPSVDRAPEKKAVRPRMGFLSWANYGKLALRVFPLAMENLRRNKLRAALTMFGVTVGVASVFAMLTFGQFAKARILEGYEDLGVNSVVIRGYPNWYRKATDVVEVLYKNFSWEKDVLPVRRIFPQVKLLSPMMSSWGGSVNYGGTNVPNDINVIGVSSEYLRIANRGLIEGRNFTPYHVENRSRVCLIGSEVASRLFKGKPALDKLIFLSRNEGLPYPCRVIGVLKPATSNKDWRKPNLEILMPFTFFQAVTSYWEAQMFEFAAQMEPKANVESTSNGIRNYFAKKYGVSGKFSVDSDTLLTAQMNKFLSLFAFMLTLIASVTLGVGGMGINNMMLVSISERLKEIGLRKAMGATDRSIRVQFLLESTLLSLVAGIFGILVGFTVYEGIIFGASKVISKIQFEWIFNPGAFALSVGAIVAVGILSGIVPALRAERLSVIEALRSE